MELSITNLERLKMDIDGITIADSKLTIYLLENGLTPTDTYNTNNPTNLKGIYSTALNILEGLANNPSMMKSIKIDDMTVSEFHENLMKRIDQLDNKIRNISVTDDAGTNNNTTFLFYK